MYVNFWHFNSSGITQTIKKIDIANFAIFAMSFFSTFIIRHNMPPFPILFRFFFLSAGCHPASPLSIVPASYVGFSSIPPDVIRLPFTFPFSPFPFHNLVPTTFNPLVISWWLLGCSLVDILLSYYLSTHLLLTFKTLNLSCCYVLLNFCHVIFCFALFALFALLRTESAESAESAMRFFERYVQNHIVSYSYIFLVVR